MPAFESIIVGAPAGFNQSCNDLNKLAIVDPQLLAAIVKKSLLNINYVPSDPQELKYQNEIKTINFIIRSFKAATPAPTFPQMASALDLNSLLSRDCVEKIIVAIQENSENQNQSAPLLSQMSGKMQNLKWRVGVAMSSNKCKSLGAPYVSLSFDVKETDGTTSHHSTELTYEQFKDFKASFEQVTAAMDEL